LIEEIILGNKKMITVIIEGVGTEHKIVAGHEREH
jgi:hypothetical protein